MPHTLSSQMALRWGDRDSLLFFYADRGNMTFELNLLNFDTFVDSFLLDV